MLDRDGYNKDEKGERHLYRVTPPAAQSAYTVRHRHESGPAHADRFERGKVWSREPNVELQSGGLCTTRNSGDSTESVGSLGERKSGEDCTLVTYGCDLLRPRGCKFRARERRGRRCNAASTLRVTKRASGSYCNAITKSLRQDGSTRFKRASTEELPTRTG